MTRTKKTVTTLTRRALTTAELDRVRGGNALTDSFALLLDEGDALLGTRSEVKDAHDRYASFEGYKYPL